MAIVLHGRAGSSVAATRIPDDLLKVTQLTGIESGDQPLLVEGVICEPTWNC